jgi:hypothetical protein
MINQDEDMKMSFRYILTLNYCRGLLDHKLFLNIIALNWSECAHSLIIFLWTILSSIHWFIIWSSLPPVDLNIVCFPSRRSIVLPPEVSRRIDVISVRNLQTLSMFFLFENLSYFGIKSHISKVMSIQVWLLKWNQRDVSFLKYFWKSSFIGQRSNIRYSM